MMAMGLQTRMVMVTRRGRKRKSGYRKASGDMRLPKPPSPESIAATMPHRRSVAAPIRHDARAESEIGRLLLREIITDQEYEAGRWYAGVVSKYRAMIEAPSANPPSIELGAVSHGPAFVDEDEAQRRRSVYVAAFEAVEAAAGHRGAVAVRRTAIHDETCPADELGHLRRGLIGLAVHRGMLRPGQALDLLATLRYRGK